eukprot:COSAG03_NODE_2244_length_2962_cov_2.912679_2_plen_116_part_00
MSQPPRGTGRSALCSRHQHGSADHSSWFVVRVAQLCRIGQVCRKVARNAGLVALAAAHVPSYLPLVVTTSMQRGRGHAAWVRLCQNREEAVQPRLFSIPAVGLCGAVRVVFGACS